MQAGPAANNPGRSAQYADGATNATRPRTNGERDRLRGQFFAGPALFAVPAHPNMSPPEPSGPRYSARVALSCERGHAPGQVLHALQELRQVIDDRLRNDLGSRYDRHNAQSVGTDKLTVTFTLRAATHADAIRSAGLAAGTLAELLTQHGAAVDLSGIALVVRAQ